MKKYLMMGAAALAVSSAFVGCSKEKDLYDPTMNAQQFLQNYQDAFIKVFGEPAANQTWGFGNPSQARMTRSQDAPEVLDISQPFDEAWVATYQTTAKEPDATNTTDNYDNTTYAFNYDVVNYLVWEEGGSEYYTLTNSGKSWEEQLAYCLEKHPEWLKFTPDETFVRNFKITGTYNGYINVAATEGYTDGVANGNERTVVVTGTWNITEDQRIGSLGKIIVANGGVVNVAEGKQLNMVNQARLVVLPGGKLTGAGKVEVNNGNDAGEENYNGGIIDVASFNNNFGKFYNYGKFLVNEYEGGAKESNFYNHSLVAIDHFSSTANARIFNGCQFYVKNDARIRNYEGVQGSALIVGGQLLFSGSEDGTTDPTYVGLAAGALVQAGSLYNNGTSWTGPTEGGYAVLNIGQFDFMNWVQDAPQNGGYFANNIYLVADVLDNVPDGNGMQQKEDNGTEYYTMSKADWKFENVVANAVGNGNVTIAEKGDYEVIPADDDFVLGQEGCTPGFKIKKDDDGDKTKVLPSLHVMAEDLTAQDANDFDFNDVVFDVDYIDANTVKVTLLAAGGTLPLRFNGDNNLEVHYLFGVPTQRMVNTGTKYHTASAPYSQEEGKDPVEFYITDKSWSDDQATFAAQVNTQIVLTVQHEDGGEWSVLAAEQGKPTAKVATPKNISVNGWYDPAKKWAWEKQNIGSKFSEWVSNPSYVWYTTE